MVRAYRGLEKRFLERFYAEFIILGSYRYGLFPDGDHTICGWRGRGGGGLGWLRTRSADAYIGLHRTLKKPWVILIEGLVGQVFWGFDSSLLGMRFSHQNLPIPPKVTRHV